MLVYQSKIVPKWNIKNEYNYFVASDNNVYNLKTKKKLQMQLKGYTKGYYLSGRFYSLIQLRKLLVKINKIKCPF
jgi:hypothetical protein